MKDNVYRFRSVKWGDPDQKLKMIPENVGRPRWQMLRLRPFETCAVVVAFAAGIVGGLFLLQ